MSDGDRFVSAVQVRLTSTDRSACDTKIAPGRSPKDGRIAVRASREERELIAQASRASATTVSAFVLRASIAQATDVLAERREFRLRPDQWDAFVAMLDRPAVAKSRLRRLLAELSLLDR